MCYLSGNFACYQFGSEAGIDDIDTRKGRSSEMKGYGRCVCRLVFHGFLWNRNGVLVPHSIAEDGTMEITTAALGRFVYGKYVPTS